MDQRFQQNIPLSKMTTLQIGGTASYYIEVTAVDELKEVLAYATKNHLEYLIIGGGSNLLVSDSGVNKLIIKNSIKGIEILDGDLVVVKSGITLDILIAFTISSNLSGLQKLIGIPGTVGGAVYGNAGAYGQTISDHLVQVKGVEVSGEEIVLDKDQCGFSYRDSDFKRNGIIITEVSFRLTPGEKDALKAESEETLKTRVIKYPTGIKCPGSFFKNVLASDLNSTQLANIPEEKIVYGKVPAGYLLEEVGAKGQRQGQIFIAPYHANLFINEGNGTASDFYKLAKTFKYKVKERFGIDLEPEVQLINLPPLS